MWAETGRSGRQQEPSRKDLSYLGEGETGEMGAAGRTWVESWRKGTLQEIPSLTLREDKGPGTGASAIQERSSCLDSELRAT